MSFLVPPDAYGRFMGRYAEPLAEVFVAFAGVGKGDKVLDVGCGPGALTAHLLSVGGEVSAIDPSPPFIDAIRARFPGVDVREGIAEELPYDTGAFDAALAQLVVHFMTDPVVGIRQMQRVTQRGGVVAACVWDGPTGALAPFWDAVHLIDPEAEDEALLYGAHMGHLTELFEGAGLRDVAEDSIVVDVMHSTFEEWWEPYTYGVGPAGDYVQRLDGDGRARLDCLSALMIGGVAATTALIAYAAPAGAEGMDVGSGCPADQIGNAATANDGTAVRCTADERGAIHWLAVTAAVSTIATLEAQGYTLTVDRVGDNPLESCVVTEVHNAMTKTERVGSGGSTPGGPGSTGNKPATTIVVVKKIDVSLDCTGS